MNTIYEAVLRHNEKTYRITVTAGAPHDIEMKAEIADAKSGEYYRAFPNVEPKLTVTISDTENDTVDFVSFTHFHSLNEYRNSLPKLVSEVVLAAQAVLASEYGRLEGNLSVSD